MNWHTERSSCREPCPSRLHGRRPCAADLPAFGSFEAWSAIVRAICKWLDLADPWKGTVEGLRKADRGDELHAALLTGLAVLDPGGHGLTAGQIVRRLEDDRVAAEKNERAPHHATLLDALDELRDKQGRLSAQRLGTRLHLLREKRKGGAWITEAERESRSGSPRWVVRRSAGVAGAKPTQREGEKGEEQADHTHDHAPARARETAGNSPASPASPANGDGATVATASDWLAPGPEVPTAAAPVWAADEDSGE